MPEPRTIVKTVPNATLYSDGTILVKEVRFSYPHVLVPKGGTGRDGKPITPAFSIAGLMDKKTHIPAKNLLKEVIDGILKEHKVADIKADSKFLRDGNQSGKEAYKGHFTVSARETQDRPPSVRAADGRTKLGVSDKEKVYGGCWGNMLIRPWWQDNEFGKRVNAGITAVQLLPKPGEAFGEGRMSEDEIDETFADESDSGFDDDIAEEASDL